MSKKISYRLKEPSTCPLCYTKHYKEEMLTGGGRLIAGKLTEELRRLYEPSKKYGKLYPLAYVIQVCPKCLFSAFPKDFAEVSEEEKKPLKSTTDHRRKLVKVLFGDISFEEDRNLVLGCASYILAVDCYHLREDKVAPTPKKAVCSIRAAWLLDDLFQEASYRPYDKARDFYYMEAAKAYMRTLEILETGEEPVEAALAYLGPDLEKNWGFDGVVYLNALLTFRFLEQFAPSKEEKLSLLNKIKLYLSRLYGSGKASKAKPSVIIDLAKDLYDNISEKIEELENSSQGS